MNSTFTRMSFSFVCSWIPTWWNQWDWTLVEEEA